MQRRKLLHIITERVNCEPCGITVDPNIMQFELILGDIFAHRFMAPVLLYCCMPVNLYLLLWTYSSR